jgi:hypothetical protein
MYATLPTTLIQTDDAAEARESTVAQLRDWLLIQVAAVILSIIETDLITQYYHENEDVHQELRDTLRSAGGGHFYKDNGYQEEEDEATADTDPKIVYDSRHRKKGHRWKPTSLHGRNRLCYHIFCCRLFSRGFKKCFALSIW